MQNIHRLSFAFLCLFAANCIVLHAQPRQQTIKADTARNLKKFRVLGFPVVSYSPETRIGFGAAGIAIFRLGNDPLHTSPSQVSMGLGYTQNKQQLYYSSFQLYTNRNMFNIYGEAGYYKYPYYYYGIGTNVVPRELYTATYPRLRVSVLYKWAPHYYAGLRYNYENYRMDSTLPGGELSKGIIAGSMGSVSSGAGIVQILDKRDSTIYPTKGYWMELALFFNTRSLGSTYNYQQYSYDVTCYKRVYKKVVWASELFAKYLAGTVPFDQLAFLGGARKLRGVYEGKYRDKHSLMVQTEFRTELYKRFGAAVFGGVGFLGGDNDKYVRLGNPYWAYGAGLRFKVNKNDHLNLRLDYALNNGKGNFYATFGEAF